MVGGVVGVAVVEGGVVVAGFAMGMIVVVGVAGLPGAVVVGAAAGEDAFGGAVDDGRAEQDGGGHGEEGGIFFGVEDELRGDGGKKDGDAEEDREDFQVERAARLVGRRGRNWARIVAVVVRLVGVRVGQGGHGKFHVGAEAKGR